MAREQFQKEQETTDEPAREGARPTENGKLYHYRTMASVDNAR
jgi:hypothetical protein